MIELRGIDKRYGKVHVLRELSLEIGRGRVTAVVGPNGAGKTTLIKIILGLARADAGEVRLGGVNVGTGHAYREHIGYMPQIARFPANLTGSELMEMLENLRGAPAPADTSLIESFGLEQELHKPLRVLSGGTRQKINAVTAFLFDPDLLILDEPTAGLDPVASGVLKDKILRDRAAGRTFILTSHIMSELEELADDVAFLLDGRVHFAGSIQELMRRTKQARLERAIAEMMVRGVAA